MNCKKSEHDFLGVGLALRYLVNRLIGPLYHLGGFFFSFLSLLGCQPKLFL